MGMVKIFVIEEFLKGKIIDGWFEFVGDYEGIVKFYIILCFIQVVNDKYYNVGVVGGVFEGVIYMFFFMCKGCKVIFYQNVYIDEIFSFKIKFDNG